MLNDTYKNLATIKIVKICLSLICIRISDMIGDIEKGKFIEDRKVMCYIACIYQMSQIVRILLNLLIFRLKISVCFYIYYTSVSRPLTDISWVFLAICSQWYTYL